MSGLVGTVLLAGTVLCFGLSVTAVRAASNCDPTIYGVLQNGGLYSFLPPAATATTVVGAPALPFGTIARGVYTGKIYIVAGTTSNSGLYTYDLVAKTLTLVGTFPNTSFLYASGFSIDGLGYALSSNETYSFTDATTPVITKLGPPQTTSGPAVTAFNSGDLAVDLSNNGWTVLSNNATGLSYLYKVTFGNPTLLVPVAQITLGGTAYTTADLYSLAFGADGTLYTSSGNNGTLFSISQSTGALTSFGPQGEDLVDFASCPFAPQPFVNKSGPTQTAVGELMYFSITASNSPSATVGARNLTLSDPVPAGITVLRATCTGSNGGTCTAATISGQTVTTTIGSLPVNGSVVLAIYGRDAGLAVGNVTNTATLTSPTGTTFLAPATTNVVANTVTKTVADITKGSKAGTSDIGVPGDVLEYTLSYTNSTNQSIAGFTLQDTVPTNTTYVAASAACKTVPTGLTCTPAGPTTGVLSWALTGGSLAPGQTVTVLFHVTIN
jgi:uncharacterized repeat protein (TIGR01451 family)